MIWVLLLLFILIGYAMYNQYQLQKKVTRLTQYYAILKLKGEAHEEEQN